MKLLRRICDVIAPENAFALYFLGYLQDKMYQKIEPGIINRLRKKLATSSYWIDRFSEFSLSLEDLTGSNNEVID